jgi:PAS domain S-box-containing protein
MDATDTDGRLSIADLSDDKQARMAIQHNPQRFRAIYETEVTGADNRPLPLDFSLMPIRDPHGETILILAQGRDLSTNEQTNERSQNEHFRDRLYSERLAVAIRVAKAGAWSWDVNNQQVFWTPEFEILFDYEPGSTQQLYREWIDRVHPEDRERVETQLQQTIHHQLPEFRCDYRIVWRDGQIRWLATIGELHSQAQGNPQMSGLVYDITDRKQVELINQAQTTELQQLNHALMLAQQQLSKRNEELDRFGFSVAHDLKAPLRSIANLSAWIEEDLSDRIEDRDRQQFQLLRQRVQRMDALVDGLLNYSRLGRQDLAIETVDVAQLLTEIIDSLSSPSFQIEILSALPILDTKRILLSQVFANLISNAIKHHSQDNGRIVITAEDLGDRYQFSVADDGDGIPPGEARQRIFDIFHTLKPSMSNDNTGIGLALVKKIVEGEGGQIWVDDYPATATREVFDGKLLQSKTVGLQQNNGACFCFTWLKIN